MAMLNKGIQPRVFVHFYQNVEEMVSGISHARTVDSNQVLRRWGYGCVPNLHCG
jgi:hypothetical protein